MLAELTGNQARDLILQFMLMGLFYLGAVILIPMAFLPRATQHRLGFRQLHFRGGRVECSSVWGRLALGGWGVMFLVGALFVTYEYSKT